jgi:squalene-hopene/tetraprenyl-beta-curcumene cyclase
VRAAQWLTAIQNEDGGWGEDGASYRLDYKDYAKAPSTPSQTAWALLGLMALGQVSSEAAARGVDYLLRTQKEGGDWQDIYHNAPGFPRIFYLRYHGYTSYFPLWALARYRRLSGQTSACMTYGM